MSYLGLFRALEALFVPTGQRKHKTLACRVALFLDLSDRQRQWLQEEYALGRSTLAHGVDDAMPWSELPPEKWQALGCLHEMTRLCVLGFMSLDDEVLRSLSDKSGKKLETLLNDLPPATGKLVQGQTMWCDWQ